MNDSVLNLLNTHGPCLTSDLIAAMVEQGLSPSAARQRVTRAKSTYKQLAGLRFAKNARFVYHDGQYGDDKFWLAIEKAFLSSGKSYWGAMTGLKGRGGACPKSLFPIVCGAPNGRKKQLSPEIILERLISINLLEEVQDEKLGEPWVRFKPSCYGVSEATAEYRAVLLAEYIAIHAMTDWAKKLGFGSYGKFRKRGDEELAIVSSVMWDITSPSYMRPLVGMGNGKLKPGFFVCDVNLNGQITDDEVDLFIRKYDMAASPKNVAPIMAFLVADGFQNSAFDKAKSAGIVAVTIANLFGEDISKALTDLIKLLSDTGKTAAVNPGHLDNVICQLTKIEGAANNLRGALFELVVGNLAKEAFGGYLRTGVDIKNYETSGKAELDIILDQRDKEKSIIIECKSKVPGSKVSKEDVERWYSDRVPFIEETLRLDEQHYKNTVLEFELWTNGTFHQEALSWIKQQKVEFEGYSLALKDGSELKRVAQNGNVSKSTRKMLNEHYFRNPLTKLVSN